MFAVDWQFTFVLLINGVLIGLMYSLIALGFVLIYKATDAINFAQGEFVMFAGFIAAAAADLAGLPFWAAALLAIVGMVALGFGLERVVLRPLIGRPIISVIMATIGLAAVLRGAAVLAFGAGTRAIAMPIGDLPIVLGPVNLPPVQLVGAGVSLVFLAAFTWFFLKSRDRGRDARRRRQPAGGDGDGHQRPALFRARLGDGRRGLGAGRHRLGGDAGGRQPIGAGRAQGVSGGDPGRSRLDHRRGRRRARSSASSRIWRPAISTPMSAAAPRISCPTC